LARGLSGSGQRLSLIAAAYLGNPALAAVALTICAMGVYAAVPTFWTLPTGFLTGSAAAGGIALINSIGNLGGFVGPYAIGWIKDATGEITLGLVVLARRPVGRVQKVGTAAYTPIAQMVRATAARAGLPR